VFTWDFATDTPTPVIANLASSAITQYNNNGTTTLLSTTSASTGYAGASGTNNAGAAARIGALSTAESGSAAFQFTLTPSAGFEFTLSEISFGSRSTSTGPQGYSLRSSADGYASDITTGTFANNSTWALKTNTGLSFTSASEVTFRLFGHSGAGSPGANTANWRIDDLKLTLSVTTVGADTTAPTIALLTPTNGAGNVAIDSNLVVNFSESVVPISGGTITLKKADNSTVQTFTLPASEVVAGGSIVTIDPTDDLLFGTGYYVEINGVAFEDAAGNNFAGYTGNGTWAFTTIPPDTTGPSVLVPSVVPANAATGVSLQPAVSFSFSEIVSQSSGSIFIRKASDDSDVVVFDIFDPAQVAVFNDEVELIFPATASLAPNTQYYLFIPAGTFVDASPNANPSVEFGSAATSGFTTTDVPALATGTPYTQGFVGFSSTSPTLPIGWSLSGPVTGFSATPGHQLWGEGFNSGLRGGADLLGYQHTGSTETLVKKLTMVNGTGAPITDLSIAYTGRVARADQGRSPAYVVNVAGTEVTALAYSTASPDGTTLSASVGGLNIPAGGVFEISWTSTRGGGSGSSKQIGLTGVSVSAGATLLAPSLAGPNLILETLTSTGVDATASVTADGGSALTQRGFVYSLTSANATPTLGGTGVTSIIDPGTTVDEMTASLSGLASSSGYSLRAFATNSVGTSYTPVVTFNTLAPPPSFVTSYSRSFDDFTGSLPPGWTGLSSTGVNGYSGTWDLAATSAGGFAGGVSSPGVLGYQHVSTSGILAVTLSLKNDTGTTLDELYVSYLGRVGRATQDRHPEWAVTVAGQPVAALTYSTGSGVDETKATLVTGLSIAPGEVFTITWVSERGSNTETGASRQIGIEDVFVGLEQPAGGYSTWASLNGIPGEPADGDFDQDGIPNLVEYGLGLTPAVPNAAPGTFTGGVLTFTKGADAIANGDVDWTIETSPTLGATPSPWTMVTATEVGDTISYTLPTGEAKVFTRLVVTQL
jgi:hypothetical protein